MRTYLVAVDRGVAAVGRVPVVFSSTAILHCVPLTTLQSDKNKNEFYLLDKPEMCVLCLHCLCAETGVST